MNKGCVVAVIAILAMAASALQRGEAVNCFEVDAGLIHCVDFLTGHELDPPEACCDGVRKVKALAVSPDDKRAVCVCIKNAANRYTNLNDAAALSLPKKCGVTLDFPVSRTVNCNEISYYEGSDRIAEAAT